MPNIKTAIKRVRINETKKAQNIAFKSALRTAVRIVALILELCSLRFSFCLTLLIADLMFGKSFTSNFLVGKMFHIF